MKLTALVVFCLLVLFMLLTALSNSDAQQAEGKTLVQERCVQCHSLDTVRAAVGKLDGAKWHALVGRMVDQGANLSPAEKDAVAEYLTGLASPNAL